ncbi:MAG: hypothetical protein RIB84_11855 [Sneathiellaceae bacterium]
MLTHPLAEQGYYGESLERPEARGIYHDAAAEKAMFGADGLTFDSLLDAVNPLHHIPIVNSIYTELTGDKIAPGPSVIGGLLFGGAIGVVGSVANAAFEAIAGDTVGGLAMSAFRDDAPEPGKVEVGEVKLAGAGVSADDGAAAGAAASQAQGTAALGAAAQAMPPAPPIGAVAAQNPGSQDQTRTGSGPQAGALTASNMFRAKSALPAATDIAARSAMPQAGPEVGAQAASQAVPPAVAMAAMQSPKGLDRLANGTPADMPQLSADLDARLRHAQQAMAASGLVAALDAAVQARLGEALHQTAAVDGQPAGTVPPPPSSQANAAMQAQQAQAMQIQAQQILAQAQPAQAQPAQPRPAQEAQAQQATVPAGSRTYMPLDGDTRGGRRWFGLGTAERATGLTPASPQMAAQALASQVYRQQGAAGRAASGALDVSY